MPRKKKRAPRWANWSDRELLELRFKDLGLAIEGSWVEEHVARLYEELDRRGIRFRPHVWISTEWFSPDGVPGIAIPFYLIHPRLRKLERRMMLEVEGGTKSTCMKILRHEAGHAIDTAYRLHFKKRWRDTFGRFSEPYPSFYRPRPNSKPLGWCPDAHAPEAVSCPLHYGSSAVGTSL